jgi:hypothetical protein
MRALGKQRSRRIALASLIGIGGITGVVAKLAGADVPCGVRSATPAFAAWGDQNSYFVAPGGSFEYVDTAGVDVVWARTSGRSTIDRLGAALRVAENNPFNVSGVGRKSLKITGNRSFVSPRFCVASDEDALRFVVKSPKTGAPLHAYVNVQSAAGASTVDYDIPSAGAEWKVTDALKLPNLRDAKGEQWITITISGAPGTTWLVDDVMVDPWRTI